MTGTIVISLDAELGWGFHHLDRVPVDRIQAARRAWRRLLDLFDRFEVPTTWGIVGHLFLDRCRRNHTRHPAGDRCCTIETAELTANQIWFGNGLIESIRNAAVDHEIAGHSFTHVHFHHDSMSRSFVESELRASLDAAAARGISLESFIFPSNNVRYRKSVAEYGFTCYRGTHSKKSNGRPYLRRMKKFANILLSRESPPIVHPTVDEHGLIDIPPSLYLFSFEGPLRSAIDRVHGDPVVNQVKRGIDRISENDGVLHLWLHPHNLTHERDYERVRTLLEIIDRSRERGTLEVETMGGVAARTKRDRGCNPRLSR